MADDIGFIYLAVNDTMPGLVKIGYTARDDVQERIDELTRASGVPAPFKCAYSCKVRNPAEAEKQLHQNFFYCRESDNREFFRADWRVVQAVIEDDFQTLRRSTKRKKIAKDGEPVGKFTLVKWVKEGDAEKVRRVLAIGGKPDQADEYKQTALMWAAQLGHADIANILLDKGANPNKTLNNGRTALMLAVEGGHARIAKSLLDYGAHASVTDKDGETALMKTDKVEVIKTLLNSGVPANDNALRIVESDKARRVAEQLAEELIVAVRNDNAAEVQRLIATGASPDTTADNGRAALMIATRLGHAEVAKVLLDGGANPNVKNSDGESALHEVAFRGDAEAVKMLLAAGANPNARNQFGSHPLFHAAFTRSVESIKALLDGGAKPTLVNCDGDTPLSSAKFGCQYKGYPVPQNDAEAMRLLQKAMMRPGAFERAMTVDFMEDVMKGDVDGVGWRIIMGANPNISDETGTRVLAIAAKEGHAEVVKILLDAGADPNAIKRP